MLLACFVAVAVAPAWPITVPCIFLLGLGYYMLHNTLQTHATEMAPQARGSAVAFFAFCFFLGQAAGVSALGLAAEWTGYRGVFAATGLGLALLGAWFGRALRRLVAGTKTPARRRACSELDVCRPRLLEAVQRGARKHSAC